MSAPPFRILVIGDFSGSFSASKESPAFRPRLVDRDNIDSVLKSMNVSLGVQGARIPICELEDFHPDRLYEALASFQDLDTPSVLPSPAKSVTPPADLLGAILAEHGGTEVDAEDELDDEPQVPSAVRDAGNLERFVERITASHLVPAKSRAQLQHESDRQASASGRMRAILHDPAFQAVEASWRALLMLVRSVETSPDLKIYILDCTLPDLVKHNEVLTKSLEKLGPWALLCGNYVFGQSAVEAAALRRIAAMAKALHSPFIAESLPPDPDSVSEQWAELRKSPGAVWLGLALPRFLLRLPYGKDTSPIDSFDFEEMPESRHSEYLWGNPAFLCASLLAQGFEASGWEMDSVSRRVEGLPLHIYREDGEPVAKPCAEILMGQSDAETLLESGLMPLASLRDQDTVVLLRFQSIADPLQPLPDFKPL